ncbi:hypothetical protein M758_6G174500 [Ceratodon purpureus]|nr:hypothetical protein M758_6G174500 [Ceratodon purpureus]
MLILIFFNFFTPKARCCYNAFDFCVTLSCRHEPALGNECIVHDLFVPYLN